MLLQRQLQTLVITLGVFSCLIFTSCIDQPSSATGTFTGNCVPDCQGKNCGDDGCGGTCGECDTFCEDSGECCAPICEGKTAGASDGCGGCCPDCTGSAPGADDGCGGCCPGCVGKECGDDGCGGTCGGCDCGETCGDGLCVFTACDGKNCGDDGCGGTCGSCTAPADTCTGGVCTCVPDCTGKNCGPDGCGGVCGDCNNLYDDCIDGTCVCQPFCDGKACGTDGCGGLCGECGCGEICTAGNCMFKACENRSCGPDGCGGTCGTCSGSQELCDEGQCVCIPACDDADCGSDGCGGSCGECPCGKSCQAGTCTFTACDSLECGDDGCGGSCGACEDPLICVEGACQPECTPQCAGKDCGDDGCGGQCGDCDCGETCIGDQCLFDACVAMVCGDDGCGGSCGSCPEGQMCLFGTCVCEPQCGGKDCGPDGCNGTCGNCGAGQACIDGQCPPQGMECDDGNSVDWDGCTDGALSEFMATDVSPYQNVDLAVLADGSFVIVWDVSGSDGGVYLAEFNSSGQNSTVSGLKVNDFQCTTSSNVYPALASGPEILAVTWAASANGGSCEPPDGSNAGSAVVAKVYGAGAGQEIIYGGNGSQGMPDIAVLTDGSIAIAYSQASDNWGSAQKGVFAFRFSPDSPYSGTGGKVNSSDLSGSSYPRVVAFHSGRSLVTWKSANNIYGQFYTSSGGKEGAELGLGVGSEAHAAPLSSGNFVVVSHVNTNGENGYDVQAQIFNAFGFSVSPLITIGDALQESQLNPDIAVFSDDSFVVTWLDTSQGESSVLFQRFDPEGSPLGAQTVVNVTTGGNPDTPVVESFTDDSFIIAWSYSGDEIEGVFARRYEHDGTPIYH